MASGCQAWYIIHHWPPDRRSTEQVAGAFTTMCQLGGAFGVAVLGAGFAATGSYASASTFSHGFTTASAAAGLALAGAAAGTILPGLAGAGCRGSFHRPMALPPLLLNGMGAWYWPVSLAVLRCWPPARRVRA